MSAKKKIFISYRYDDDRNYKNLLNAWDKNTQFDFHINDRSADVTINSTNAATIKGVLTQKIGEVNYFMVLIGKHTKKCDWVNWEIQKAKELNKKIIAVKIHSKNKTPLLLYRSGVIWVNSFRFESIRLALKKA